jgi:hypothetical protein
VTIDHDFKEEEEMSVLEEKIKRMNALVESDAKKILAELQSPDVETAPDHEATDREGSKEALLNTAHGAGER